MRPRLAHCCLPLVSAPSYRASVPVPPGVSGPGCGVCRFPGGEDVLPEARRKAKEGGKPGRAAPLEEQRRGDPLGAAASSTQLPSIAKNKEVPLRNSARLRGTGPPAPSSGSALRQDVDEPSRKHRCLSRPTLAVKTGPVF
jgi:hypothetical protein